MLGSIRARMSRCNSGDSRTKGGEPAHPYQQVQVFFRLLQCLTQPIGVGYREVEPHAAAAEEPGIRAFTCCPSSAERVEVYGS